MLSLLFIVATLLGSSTSCDVVWPNGTDVAYHWWQCDNGLVKFTNTSPWDATGKNYEYPIHLGAPIMIKADIINPSYTFKEPNLKNTVNLWSWATTGDCHWASLPTFGLLKNLDACTNGVPCPINPGTQELDVIIDFTPYQAIINILQNDKPYQLEYLLDDKTQNSHICIMVQARAELH